MFRWSYCYFCLAVPIVLLASSPANAGPGLYAGMGVPLNLQGGLTYQFNPSYTLDISYNKGNSLTNCRDFDLRIAQLGLNYYPFAGAFFIGAGAGRTTLYASNLNPADNMPFSITAEAIVAFEKLGWTWGKSDGGFWFGIDLSYYQSLSSKKTIHAEGVDPNSKEYRRIADAVLVFTGSSHLNITFARLGWTF